MTYSDFTLVKAREAFALTLEERRNLFAGIPGIPPSSQLTMILEENVLLATAIGTEKARSEFLINELETPLNRFMELLPLAPIGNSSN